MYRRAADSKLWEIMHLVGLAPAIKRCYWNLKLKAHSYTFDTTIGGTATEFNVENSDEFKYFDQLAREKYVLEDLLQNLRPADVFFDVGANLGVYACFASNCIDGGEVVAFEPMPSLTPRLQSNLENTSGDWKTFEVALADEDTGGAFSQESGPRTGRIDDTGEVSVTMRRAESMIQNHGLPIPDVVKIDVEGAEGLVLSGFGEQLSDVRTIYCEVHPEMMGQYGANPHDLETILENHGFEIEHLGEWETTYHIRATQE